jgi:hypothetical protein
MTLLRRHCCRCSPFWFACGNHRIEDEGSASQAPANLRNEGDAASVLIRQGWIPHEEIRAREGDHSRRCRPVVIHTLPQHGPFKISTPSIAQPSRELRPHLGSALLLERLAVLFPLAFLREMLVVGGKQPRNRRKTTPLNRRRSR